MRRIDFLQLTTTFIGGISIKSFSNISNIEQSIRIGLITDLHYANRKPFKENNRFYNESLEKLAECVRIMNEENVDFLIQLGDFKDQDELPHEGPTLSYLSEIENEFIKFNGPFFHVLGNHDMDSISKQQYLDNISNWGFKYALNYYSFDMKGFHFIVLDANYTSKGIDYNRGNFDWEDTVIPPIQIEWLKHDLYKNKAKASIVFIHQRLDYIEKDQAHFVNNAFEIREILEQFENVLIVLQGHYHYGAINKINNIYYYTLQAAVEGSGLLNNNYAILEIDPNKILRLAGYRNTTSENFN